MTDTKHTPGPWQYLRSPNGPIRVGPSHNCTVAVAPFPPTGDQEANARLIVAAPDYYAAAEAIRAHLVSDELAGKTSTRIPIELLRALLNAHKKAYAT